ncbi:anhydro-N-acetylmuramic acid kinase [Vibrio sp. SCSIO 43136]|uniref:anhydro-N-acetylmuramic acid kinase n=1 Tax=Vibrio sp. SCSIO 43136 TaxID=2819101 RepID=UPI002074E683|nr:anhydro-N-acetylmuramic acid kinase [Vibrio sp. SCSIO 43136]USD64829.1 anhydro-N-acetylmuramic acid kinase [Vibrio sp. SCSIO 43136]
MSERYIGIMSGTSLDGIDCALVEISKEAEMKHDVPQLLGHISVEIPTPIKQRLLSLSLNQNTTIQQVGELDHLLGKLYADAVNRLLEKYQLESCDIRAIGNHGQTVFHQPQGATPFTTQLGDANLIVALTGITTVADFRRLDMAFGGQGAPLVPAFHQQLFGSADSSVVVLNIGGISNISVIPPRTQESKKVVGYDTGPGNMLLDAWVQSRLGQQYDQDAKLARQGQIHTKLLEQLLQEDYFSAAYPKSTGREHFNLDWLESKLTTPISNHDMLATLVELTAITVSQAIMNHQSGPAPRLLLCGGGSRNPLLVERITAQLEDWHVTTTDEFGISSEFMEAMAFAWLAYRKIHNLPSNLPDVTGASRPVSLGVIYSAN